MILFSFKLGSISCYVGVLLHEENTKKPVPIFFAIEMSESYESMKRILDAVKYTEHNWRMCCDLKVVTFLKGMQSGNTKYSCFICLWDSRFKGCQYDKKDWTLRTGNEIQTYNVIDAPLVPIEKILLPPLHVKLGIVKSFLKFMQRSNPGAKAYLQAFFPRLSAAKLAEGKLHQIDSFVHESVFFFTFIGVLVGPDIRRLINAADFTDVLTEDEATAWDAVKSVIHGFLGTHRNDDYEVLVQNMLDAFNVIHVNMSPKIHYLKSHLHFFARQLPTESDEHGERFHQVCKPFEKNYKGKSLLSLVTDLCWNLIDHGIELQRNF